MRIRGLLKKGAKLKADWLVIGLGNPGPEYAATRHNAGFKVVNELARRAGVQPKSAGGKMVAGVGKLQGQPVALMKPLTFYNQSGSAVARALHEAGCGIEHMIVVYDELDLPPGALRIRQGGGHGGNNGLKSIQAHAGTDFVRIRIGIGRPSKDGQPTRDPAYVSDWVLSEARGEDARRIAEAIRDAADAVQVIIAEGVEVAGSRFNRSA